MTNLNIVSVDPNQTYYKIQIDYDTVIGQYYKTMKGFVLTYLPNGVAASGPSSSRFSLVFTSNQDAQNFLLECKKQNIKMNSGNPKTASLNNLSSNQYAYHHYYPWGSNNTPVTNIYKSKAKYIFGDKLVNIKDFFVEKQQLKPAIIRKLSFNTNVYVPLDACVEILGIYAGNEYTDNPFQELTHFIQDNFLDDMKDIIKLDAAGVNAEVDLDKLRNAPTTALATINEELIDAENITCVGKACINDLFTPALNNILWNLEKLKSLTIKSLNTSEENKYFHISNYDFTPNYQCPNLETVNIVTLESSHIDAIRYNGTAIFDPELCPKVSYVSMTDAFKYRLGSYGSYNRNTALKELKELGLEKLSGNLQNFECVDIETLYTIMFNVLTTKYKDLLENKIVRATTDRAYDTIEILLDKPLDKFMSNLITNIALDTIGPEEDTIVYSTNYVHKSYLPSLDALCYIGYNSTYRLDELYIDVEPIFYKKGTEFAEDMSIKLKLFELVMDNIFSVLQSQEFFDDDSNFIIDESKKSKELKEEMNTYTEINSIDTVSDRAKNRMLIIPINNDPKYTLTLEDANKAWKEFKAQYKLNTTAVINDIEWKSYISYYMGSAANANIYLGFFDKPIPEKVFRKSQEEFLQAHNRAVWYDTQTSRTRGGQSQYHIKSSFNPKMTYNCIYIVVTGTEKQTITTYVDSDFILDEE